MIDREQWLKIWGYVDGTPEAEKAWAEKLNPPPRQAPMLIRDTFDQPLQSMADGKFYDSRSELYKTYRADGNPQGIEYECVGDKPIDPWSRPTPSKEDEAQKDKAISRALDEMGY
jgi:hypothetical protein